LPQYRYLKEHQKRHRINKRWICNVCGKSYSFLSKTHKCIPVRKANQEMNVGGNEHHPKVKVNEQKFNCDICAKPYKDKDSLEKHKWHHMNEAEQEEAILNGISPPPLRQRKQLHCDICLKPYKDKDCLVKHKWLHMSKAEQEEATRTRANAPPNEGPTRRKRTRIRKRKPQSNDQFMCSICGKTFGASRFLRLHEERIHQDNREREMCQKCGKMLLPGASVRYHVVACTKRDENEVHECKICNAKLKNKFTLIRHHRYHHTPKSSEKPHVCSTCGRGFKLKHFLESHKAIHSDNRPFACNGCGLTYKSKKYLQTHQRGFCHKTNLQAK